MPRKRWNQPPPRAIRPWRIVAGHWTLLAKRPHGFCMECRRHHIRVGMRIVKAGKRSWSAWQCVRARELAEAPKVEPNARLQALIEASIIKEGSGEKHEQ